MFPGPGGSGYDPECNVINEVYVTTFIGTFFDSIKLVSDVHQTDGQTDRDLDRLAG